MRSRSPQDMSWFECFFWIAAIVVIIYAFVDGGFLAGIGTIFCVSLAAHFLGFK